MPKRRCLGCSALTERTYCPTCQRARDRERNASRPHYSGSYQRLRAEAVAYWHATGAHCWLCGEPLDPSRRWPDPLSTTADHVTPGNPDSVLRPACLRCNSARGNRPAS